MKFNSLKAEYAELWDAMEVRDARLGDALAAAKKIILNRAKYEEVQRATGVPWWFVGIIHKMESNCNFTKHLHNGDPLTDRTFQVPKGRPKAGRPPFTWSESAIDALTMKGLHKLTDWSVERVAFELERYNGWGYREHHADVLSPYLWSYSNHYSCGKYVADGKWSGQAISAQCGAMPVLKALQQMDGMILSSQMPPLSVPAQIPPPAPTINPRELASRGSRSMRWVQRMKAFFGFGTTTGGGIFLLDSFEQTKDYVNGIASLLRDNATALLVVGCFGGLVIGSLIGHYIAEAARDGRYDPDKAVGSDEEPA